MTIEKLTLDPVLRDEADFANQDYAPFAHRLDIDPWMFRLYRTPRELHDWRQMSALLLGDISGKTLLDYGCGMGEESIYFAKLGAKVTGIDISEVGVASLRRRAEFNNLDIAAYQMRVDPTSFPASSFDRVHGLGILHHVGLEAGLKEVWRVLKPGGVAVFLEPMGDSPPIEAVKMFLVKHARFLGDFDHFTEHEKNLTWREVEDGVLRFAHASVFPYHLMYRAKRLIPDGWLDTVRRIDFGLLQMMPRLRRFCGGVAIRVIKQDFRTATDVIQLAQRLEPDPKLIETQMQAHEHEHEHRSARTEDSRHDMSATIRLR